MRAFDKREEKSIYLLQSGVDVAPQFTHSLPSAKIGEKILIEFETFLEDFFCDFEIF